MPPDLAPVRGTMSSRIRVFALAVAAVLGASGGAFAQTDLVGIWAPIFHEDQVERIPGPDVGDYAGLPLSKFIRITMPFPVKTD